jgi:calcium-dependent protein kinase
MGCGKSKSQTLVTSSPDSIKLNTQYLMLRKNYKKLNEEYQIGNRIGQGGFAEVRRCTHKHTGIMRAMKIYHKAEFPAEYVQAGGLQQEIGIFRMIDHPNIVKCYEFFEDDKNFYISMEFCLGGELFHMIGNNKVLTEDIVCRIMRQLLSVIAYLHDRGIVHRDLKPENILLEDRNSEYFIKLADFGNAIQYDSAEILKGQSGTSYYMAPEVIDSEYSEKCDEWSCAVIMYMLLTGNPPFEGVNDDEILASVRKQEFSLERQEFVKVSEEAKDLIKKLLVPETQRISAIQALAHPWFQKFQTGNNSKNVNLPLVTQNVKSYKAGLMLKEVVRTFIVNQILNPKEIKSIREAFSLVDHNQDGTIDLTDLVAFFQNDVGAKDAEVEAKAVLKHVDIEKKGFLEYSDFLKASIDQQVLLSRNNMIMAFSMLDTDSKGTLTAEKLMQTLGSEKNPLETWAAVMSEAHKKEGDFELSHFIDVVSWKS